MVSVLLGLAGGLASLHSDLLVQPLSPTPLTQAQVVEVLTLEEAIDIALTQSYNVLIAGNAAQRAAAQAAAARGALGPTVAAGATYSRTEGNALGGLIGGVGGGGGQGGAPLGPTRQNEGPPNGEPSENIFSFPRDRVVAQVSVSQLIDISGTLRASVRAAQLAAEAQEALVIAEANTVRRDVRTAYFNVVLAESFLQVQQQRRQSLAEQLQLAQTRFELDTVPRFDVLRFESDLAAADRDITEAENQVRLAKQALNNTLGRPIDTQFQVESDLALPLLREEPEVILSVALRQRPELVAFDRNIQSLREVRKIEQGSTRPNLFLNAAYNQPLDQGPVGDSYSLTLAAGINWTLFDSGTTRNRVRAAELDAAGLELQLEQLRLGISLEISQALSSLIASQSSLAAAERVVILATEALRLAELRYESGVGLLVEVTQALADLTAARTAEVQARVNYLQAYADLQRATGSDEIIARPAITPEEETENE